MGRLLGIVLSLAAAPAAAAPLPPALEAAVAAVRWTPARVAVLIKDLPKAELHVHLDGALSPATISRLAKEQGYAPLKDKTVEEIAALSVVSKARPSLAKVLEAFGVVYPLLRRADAVETAAYELVRSASTSNVRWLEARFAPELQAAPGFSAEDALRAALRGLARGRVDFGVKYGVILCLLRPDGLQSMEKNEATLRLALLYKDAGVVGVDLAGDESAAPLSRYAPLLRRAKDAGLGVTAHAGEVPGSQDVAAALALGADRLGHATLLSKDPASLALVRARRVPLEVNLTSNLRTSAVRSLRRHPARGWRALGIPLAVSTDDPGVFGVTLDGEYALLASQLGFKPRDLIAVALDAADAAFLPPAERKALRAEFEAVILEKLK